MPNGHHHTASSADMRQRHTASSSGALQTSLSIVTHVQHIHHTFPVHIQTSVPDVSIHRMEHGFGSCALGAPQAAAWLVD